MRLDHYHHLDQHLPETLDVADDFLAMQRERLRLHYAAARRARRRALVEAGQDEEKS